MLAKTNRRRFTAFAGDRRDSSKVQSAADMKLSFLLHDVSRMRQTAYEHVTRSAGVTRAQWHTLVHISKHEGIMQKDLAEILEIGEASLARSSPISFSQGTWSEGSIL